MMRFDSAKNMTFSGIVKMYVFIGITFLIGVVWTAVSLIFANGFSEMALRCRERAEGVVSQVETNKTYVGRLSDFSEDERREYKRSIMYFIDGEDVYTEIRELHVSFSVNGAEYGTTYTDKYRTFLRGDIVHVWYDATDPEINFVDVRKADSFNLWAGIGLLIIQVSIWMLIGSFRVLASATVGSGVFLDGTRRR